jgi:hypothetical protein
MLLRPQARCGSSPSWQLVDSHAVDLIRELSRVQARRSVHYYVVKRGASVRYSMTKRLHPSLYCTVTNTR